MRRILIVDDERLILDGLSRSFANKNTDDHTEIKILETGKEAIEEIASCFYDLCILDIYLPDINGMDVMKKIREISPETKVIIMTSYFITNEMEQEIRDKANYFIAKPFDLSEMKMVTDMVLKSEKDFQGSHRSHETGLSEIRSEKDERKFERTPLMKPLDYFASVLEEDKLKILNLRGDVVDISDDGIGIRTDYPLKPGYMVRFPSEETKHDIGVVKWSVSTGNDLYRVGIEFV